MGDSSQSSIFWEDQHFLIEGYNGKLLCLSIPPEALRNCNLYRCYQSTNLSSYNNIFFSRSPKRKLQSMASYKEFEIRKRNPDPKTCALLVIDMQNFFSSIAKPIISSIQTTIDLCRRAHIPVIYTRHCHKSPADYGMMEEWWGGELIFDGTPESDLLPEVGRREGDLVVEKSTYGGFTKTQLEKSLLEMGVKEVIVTGVMTNLCCETTAREAFLRGFRVFFSTDATATSSLELHEATLKNMAYGFAYLVDCSRLKDAFLVNSANN